jgi:RNA polymerase sigma-70 factor, ECF subfamily
VIVNACLDRLRAAKVRRADPLPDDLDDAGRGSVVTANDGSDEHLDPAEHNLRNEQRALVLAALQQLPGEQRAALVLVDMEGYTVAEVAEILDCAEGTVKSRCARGRAKLAVLLRPLLADDTADTDETLPTSLTGNPDTVPDVGSLNRRGPPADPAVDAV